MALLILIPFVLCVIALIRSNAEEAFVMVCIPVLMILPVYLQLKWPHMPPLDMGEMALLPLGIALLFGRGRKWKFSRTDIWILFFMVSGACYADFEKGDTAGALYGIFAQITTALFPYMAGKLLIEQSGRRVIVAKRIVWCVFLICVPSMFEFVGKRNLFQNALGRLDPEVWGIWHTQIRWGFGRVAGPYGQSELAGMIFLTTIILTLWLGHWGHWSPHFAWAKQLPLKKGTIILLMLLVTLFTTQARGPWLGTILGCTIAFVGLSKRPVRTSIMVGAVLLIAGTIFYSVGSDYLNAPAANAEQQTAQYRQELFKNYRAIAEQGGAWGWGSFFPRVGGQVSVDNQYLLSWLAQGYIGLATLVLLLGETVFSLGKVSFGAAQRKDRHFAFCLQGIMCGLMLTIGTVYLGDQSYQLFFLLIGWSQALSVGRSQARSVVPITAALQVDELRIYT